MSTNEPAPSFASGVFHASALVALTGAGLLLGWLVVWRCVLSKLPQVQKLIRDVFGLGDGEAKREARERRDRRRKERAKDTERALRVARELKEKVVLGAISNSTVRRRE